MLRAGVRPTPLTVAEIHEIPPPAGRVAVGGLVGAVLLLGALLGARWRRSR